MNAEEKISVMFSRVRHKVMIFFMYSVRIELTIKCKEMMPAHHRPKNSYRKM